MVNGSTTKEIDLPRIKGSFPELFDDYDSNSTLRTGSYRGLGGAFHGQGGRARQAEVDREKYFRYLDSSFQRIHDDTGLPMIVAGTESTVAEFMKLAKGDFYLKDPVAKPIESLDTSDLQGKLGDMMAPYSKYRLESLSTLISNKRNENKALSRPADIQQASKQGNVEMLILSQDLIRNPEEALLKAAEDTIRFGGTLITVDKSELNIKEKSLALLRSSS